MAVSARRDLLEAVLARLQGIRTSNGYNTEAGQLVYLGERPVQGPDDPSASIAMIVGDDDVTHQMENVVVRLPIEVQAWVRVDDVAAPWRTAEDVLTDIKTAIESDRDLGGRTLRTRGIERGTTKFLPREAGSEFTGVSITYVLVYGELWGTP